jgi:hypothetical protein
MHGVEMNEHQHRLWLSMLKMIEDYRKGAVSFPQVVGQLEGALDAGEFRDERLVERFYEFWQRLEITNAVRGNAVTYEEVAEDIDAMQHFLLDHLITEQLEKS